MNRKFTLSLLTVFALLLSTVSFAHAQATLEKPKTKKADQQTKDKAESADQESEKAAPDSDQEKPKSNESPEEKKNSKAQEKKEEAKPERTRGRFPWDRNVSSSKDAKELADVFRPVAASMEDATIRIMKGETNVQLALGTVIESDGLILTKASELAPDMKCMINGERFQPRVVGIHPPTDLALLRVDTKSLNQIQWSDQPLPSLGRWVVSPKAKGKAKPGIGIIATEKARKIPPSSPFIGIEMEDVKEGIRITKIVKSSPAALAGLAADDVIFQIEAKKLKARVDLVREIRKFEVGDRVSLKVLRNNKEQLFKVTLGERDKISPQAERSNQQNSMGSKLSRRRRDFPKAFQHDTMLNSNTCGGPIVDLTGKVIGINIARDGRVSSLALPRETILPIIDLLKSGDLSPAVVNKAKIEILEAELKDIDKNIGRLPMKKNVLNIRYNKEKARLEELSRFEDDYDSRIEELETMLKEYRERAEEVKERKKDVAKKTDELKDELSEVKDKLKAQEQVKKKLEEDLEGLKTGSVR